MDGQRQASNVLRQAIVWMDRDKQVIRRETSTGRCGETAIGE